MAQTTDLPFLFRPLKVVETTTIGTLEQDNFHPDLLSFLSIAHQFQVDMVSITWQPALQSLGKGASSLVSQAQIDALMYLAFKRLSSLDDQLSINTELAEQQRYRTLINELIALEKLRTHPNVIDLLGVTWETDNESMQVRPVLLSERSRLGHLANFLNSSSGHVLEAQEKLELCCDIARACEAMHGLGIVHGDIKLENVLVFENKQVDGETDTSEVAHVGKRKYLAKVIDFGYSCLGFSKETQVRVSRTRPWQAPEHRIDAFVSLEDAMKMDIYGFGMLLCCIFIPDMVADLVSLKPAAKTYDAIDDLKASSAFVELVKTCLDSNSKLKPPLKSKLLYLLPQILEPDPKWRKFNFRQIVETLDPGTDFYHSLDSDSLALGQLTHTIVEIRDIIANIDDEDYLLKAQLCQDLRRRVDSPNCGCFIAAARNLGLCYEIGFGTRRNTSKAHHYFALGKLDGAGQKLMLDEIDQGYEAREPLRLRKKLGYDITLPFDPVQLYRSQGRLKAALATMQQEADDRRQAFGELTRPYLAQISNLMLFLIDDGQLEKAAEVGRQTVKTCEQVYGPHDSQTINSYNYLAFVLFQCGFWNEVEEVQLKLIPRKEQSKDWGPTNATTLNSHNYLVAVYCLQGRYEECLRVARKLVSIRRELIGKTHTETITTETWMCRALLEKGELFELEHDVADLLERSEEIHGKDDLFALQVKDILAAAILANAIQDDDSLDSERASRALRLAGDVVGHVNASKESRNTWSADPKQKDSWDGGDSQDSVEHPTTSIEHDGGSRRLTELETILLLRSTATMICAFAVQGDFENAERQIDTVHAVWKLPGPRTDIESTKLKEVIDNFFSLKELMASSCQGHQVDALKKKLAHRWKD